MDGLDVSLDQQLSWDNAPRWLCRMSCPATNPHWNASHGPDNDVPGFSASLQEAFDNCISDGDDSDDDEYDPADWWRA